MERIASATGVPCETRTSIWGSLGTISAGVCLFWRIVILRLALMSHPSGRTTSTGADYPDQTATDIDLSQTCPGESHIRSTDATVVLSTVGDTRYVRVWEHTICPVFAGGIACCRRSGWPGSSMRLSCIGRRS